MFIMELDPEDFDVPLSKMPLYNEDHREEERLAEEARQNAERAR